MAPGNDRARDEPAKSKSRPLAALGQSLRRGLTTRRSNKGSSRQPDAAETAQPAAQPAPQPTAQPTARPAEPVARGSDRSHASGAAATAVPVAGKRSTFSKVTYMPSPLSRGALPGAATGAGSLGLGGSDAASAASSIYGGSRSQRVASASGAHPGSAAAGTGPGAAAHFRKTLYGSTALVGMAKPSYASSSPALSSAAPGGAVAAGAMAVPAGAGGAGRGDGPLHGRKAPPADTADSNTHRDYSFVIAGGAAQSARSSSGMPVLPTKEGYLSKKTDINPSTSLASALSRGWKVYRVVLKGAKIFFYKPPSESELRAMFPEEIAAATNETAGGYVRSSMALVTYDDAGTSSSAPGFPMAPGEVDSGLRGILFEPGVCDGEITAPLCERYGFGECFTEVDLRSLKFKRYVCVLIFDDTIVVLKRRWVRQGLASSFFGAVSNKMRFGKNTHAKTHQPADNSSLISSELGIAGKGYFTKWKFHSQYPLASAEAVEAASSRFSVAHAPGVLGHLSRESQAGSGRISLYSIGNSSVSSVMTRTSTVSKDYSGALSSGLVPGFQLFVGGKERVARMFVATTYDAKNTWLSRFAAAKASYARRLRQRPHPRDNTAAAAATAAGRRFNGGGSEQPRPATAAMAKDLSAEAAHAEDKPKDARTRLYWGTQQHPELVVAPHAAGSEAAGTVVVGGSRSALVHELVFRTVAAAPDTPSFSAQLVGTYPLLMSHTEFLGELRRYAGLVVPDAPEYAALAAGLGEVVVALAGHYAHAYDADQIEALRTIVATAIGADPDHDVEALAAIHDAINDMNPVAAPPASDDANKSQHTAGPSAGASAGASAGLSADAQSLPLTGLESYEIIGSISSAMGTKIAGDIPRPPPPRGRSRTHHGEPELAIPQIPTVPELIRVEITGLTPSLLLRVPPHEFAHQLYLFHKSQLVGFNPKLAQLYIPQPPRRSATGPQSLLTAMSAPSAAEPNCSPARNAASSAGLPAADAAGAAGAEGSLDMYRQLMVFTQHEPHFVTRLVHHHLLVELPLNRPARRSAVLQQWVRIGEECRAIGDAVAWAAIAMAVTMAPIARLGETWHSVALSWKELIVSEWVPLLIAHGLHEADIGVPGQPADTKPLIIRPQQRSGASTPTAGPGYSYTPIPYYGTIRMRVARQGRRLQQEYAPALAAAGGGAGALGSAAEPGDKLLFAHYGHMFTAAQEAAADIPNSVVERARTDIMRSRASSLSLASKFQQGGGAIEVGSGIGADRRSMGQDALQPPAQLTPSAAVDPSILSHPFLQAYLKSLALNPLKIGDELAGTDSSEYDVRYLQSISLQCEPSVGDLYHQHMLQVADDGADDAVFAQPMAPSALRQAPGSILPLVCPETVPSTNILQWITPAARTPAPAPLPVTAAVPAAGRGPAMAGRAGTFSHAQLRPDPLALGSSGPVSPRKALQGSTGAEPASPASPASPTSPADGEPHTVRQKRSQSFPDIGAGDSADAADGTADASQRTEQQQISDAAHSHAVFSGTTVYAANGDLALRVLRVQQVRPTAMAVPRSALRFVAEVQGGTLPIMLDLLINGIEHYSAGLITDKGVPLQLPGGATPALVFNRDVFQRTFMASFRHFCTGLDVVDSMRQSLAQFGGQAWPLVEASLTALLDVCENWLGQHFADFLDSTALRDAMADFVAQLRDTVTAQRPASDDALGSWTELCSRVTLLVTDLATHLLMPSGHTALEKALDRRLAAAVSRERRESAAAQLDMDLKSPLALLSLADPDVVLVSLNRLAQTHFARCSFNDWLVAFCLLEVQTHAPLPWYPKKRMTHVPPEEDLTVSDIYQVLEQTHRGRSRTQAHELSGAGSGGADVAGASVSTAETSLMRTLPHSIQTMLELHRTVRGWVVRQIADPSISLTQRVARIQKFLTMIRLCRRDSQLATSHVFGSLLNSYMREAGMIPDRQPSYRAGSVKRYSVGTRVGGETGRRGRRKGGQSQAKYVPSFVERAVASALVSPESRQFVRAWNEVAAENSTKLDTLEAVLRGARDWAAFDPAPEAPKDPKAPKASMASDGAAVAAADAEAMPKAVAVHRSYSNPTADGIDVTDDSMARADCFVPCLGWLLENMVSLCYDTPDTLAGDSRLVNLAKRHRMFIMLCVCDQLASRCQEAFALPTRIRIDNDQFGSWVAQTPLRMADIRAASSAELALVLATEQCPGTPGPVPGASTSAVGSAAASGAGSTHAAGLAGDRSFSFSSPLAHAPSFGRPGDGLVPQTPRHAHTGGFAKRSIANLRGAPSSNGSGGSGASGSAVGPGGDQRGFGSRKAAMAAPHATPDFGGNHAFGSPPAPVPRALAFPDGPGSGAGGAGGPGGVAGAGAVYGRPFTRLVTDEIEKARQEIRERERLERELRDREQTIERQKNERTKILKRQLKEQQQRRAKNEPLLKMASLMNKVGGISARESSLDGGIGAAPGGSDAAAGAAEAGSTDLNRLSAASASRPRGPALPSTKPANVINLINSTISIEQSYTKRDYVFRIVTEEGGQYLLQAPDQEQMEAWIGAMRDAATEAAARRLTLFVEEAKKHSAGGAPTGPAPGDADAPAFHPPGGRHPANETTRSRFTAFLGGGAAALGAFGMSSGGPSRGALAAVAAPQAKEPAAVLEPKSFGVDLAQQMPDAKAVPVIVEKCLTEIELRGLEEVGIYRVSGAAADVSRLRNLFNADPDAVELGSGEFDDINVVSGVIKQFLRELPEPLLTFSLYDGFINAASIDDYDERLWAIKDLVHALPTANYTVLKRLVEHLERVTDYEEINHMYGTNLALVFGPSLLRPPPGSSSFALAMSNLGHAQSVIKNIILQYHWIFNVEEEAEPMEDRELDEAPAAADDAPPASQEPTSTEDDDDVPLKGLAVDVKPARRPSSVASPLTPTTQADMDQLAAAVNKLSV